MSRSKVPKTLSPNISPGWDKLLSQQSQTCGGGSVEGQVEGADVLNVFLDRDSIGDGLEADPGWLDLQD